MKACMNSYMYESQKHCAEPKKPGIKVEAV